MKSRRIVTLTLIAVACILLAVAVLLIPGGHPPTRGSRAGEAWDNGLMSFRWCPLGSYTMGSPATEAGRRGDEDQIGITFKDGFWMGRTEVTQSQWRSVMKNDCWEAGHSVNVGAAYPVVCVSHSGEPLSAAEFCRRLTAKERAAGRLPNGWEYRLPSEAEWEYACRAGTTTEWAFGTDESKFSGHGRGRAHRPGGWLTRAPERNANLVGSKAANAWGLRDMHGNVAEWCAELYVKDRPGIGDEEIGIVVKGGGWDSPPSRCRSAYRDRYTRDFRGDDVGFRVVLSPSPNQAAAP